MVFRSGHGHRVNGYLIAALDMSLQFSLNIITVTAIKFITFIKLIKTMKLEVGKYFVQDILMKVIMWYDFSTRQTHFT